MAWEWSHTTEAYVNACDNVHNRDRDWLMVVYAEWEAKSDPNRVANGFSQRKYKRALGHAKKLPNDVLADYIWEKMEEQRLCTNGGHNAWACPWGCHLVSFDHEETAEEAQERLEDEMDAVDDDKVFG